MSRRITVLLLVSLGLLVLATATLVLASTDEDTDIGTYTGAYSKAYVNDYGTYAEWYSKIWDLPGDGTNVAYLDIYYVTPIHGQIYR